MPQVAIPHLLGTVMLLGLLGIVIVYAQTMEVNSRMKAVSVQLDDVSEYVSSELISLIDLASSQHNSSVIYKTIEIPKELNGIGYVIELENISGKWMIISYLYTYPSVKGEAYLYFSGGVNATTGNGYINVENGRIAYSSILYSGVSKPVVWCKIEGGTIYVGLGRLEVS